MQGGALENSVAGKWQEKYMGVLMNGGSTKMVGLFQGKSQLKMDDLGVPLFQETPIYGVGLKLATIPVPPYLRE